MSENMEVKQTNAELQDNSKSELAKPLSPENLQLIRAQLLEKFSQAYSAFLNVTQNYPINPNIKNRGIGYFDDGYLWICEGLRNIELAQIDISASQEINKKG